jgi:23S rRNA U2552 (ribose-2'-O)-methylase RlmE/FtsJ
MAGSWGRVVFTDFSAGAERQASGRLLDMESSLIVSLHIQSIDQTAAIKTIKRKITDLDKMKIEEQKKAVRSGYDMDIIPSDLATYGGEAKKLLQDLQSHNERIVSHHLPCPEYG